MHSASSFIRIVKLSVAPMGVYRRAVRMNPPLARSSILQPLNLGIRRSFGSKYPKVNENNPFDILGIPKASSYQEVKRRFVELALKHHPDLSDEQGDSTEFVRVRQAFEMIRETEDGRAKLSSAGDGSGWSDEEFQAWFFEETGHQDLLFRMDRATRKEVVEVANSQSQGGLDRGGMWEMARSMAEQEESLRKKKGDFRGTIGIDSDEKGKPAASPRRRRRK